MNSQDHTKYITEVYEFYYYNDETFYYNWNNKSVFGELVSFVISNIASECCMQDGVLYSVGLEIDRNPDEPNDLYEYRHWVKVVKNGFATKHIERTAKRVRLFKDSDRDILADDLLRLRDVVVQNNKSLPKNK